MKRYATFFVLLAGACWGAIGVFVRVLSGYDLQPLEIIEGRAITAAIIIGIMMLIRDRNLFKIKLSHLWCFVGTGAVGIVGFNFCYFITIEASSLSVAAILLYTAPIFVMILSAFIFHEKVTRIKLVSLVLTFTGCALVSGVFDGSAVLTAKGIGIGIMAGVGYALYTIFMRCAINRGYTPLTIQFYTFLVGSITGAIFIDFGHMSGAISTYGIKAAAILFLSGIVVTVIPNMSYNFGLQYIDNSKTSIMASLEPVMAIIYGIFLFHEIPSFLGAIGMVISLTGIVLVNYEKGSSRQKAGL